MSSPLAAKKFFEDQFFVVAVSLKRYYNPVNLENDGYRVKQKEFIQSIGEAKWPPLAAYQRSGPPRGHVFVRVTRLGSPGPRHAAAYAEPLPPFLRI